MQNKQQGLFKNINDEKLKTRRKLSNKSREYRNKEGFFDFFVMQKRLLAIKEKKAMKEKEGKDKAQGKEIKEKYIYIYRGGER